MRKKIYYILSTCSNLEATSGDRINEMNVIRALCINFDVYYNNILVDPTSSYFGSLDGQIEPPNQKYDLYYVRANKDLFLKLPSPKIWFVVPYVPECYAEADAVVCITSAWKDRMQALKHDFILQELMGIRDQEIVPGKKYITFPQVIDPIFFKNKDEDKIRFYKEQYASDFVCGHMGRLVKSNYPWHLEYASKNYIPNIDIKYIFYGPKNMDLPNHFHSMKKIPMHDVPEALSAFDISVTSSNNWTNLCGQLKVLEAAACGVPILTPHSLARYDDLGKDYPFYWNFSAETHNRIQNNDTDIFTREPCSSTSAKQPLIYRLLNKKVKYNREKSFSIFEKESNELGYLIKALYLDKSYREEISKSLMKQAKKHSVENISKILVEELSMVIK